MRQLVAGLAAAGIAVLAAGCSSSAASSGSGSGSAAQQVTLRLGFLANITHERSGRPQGLLHQGPGQERHAEDPVSAPAPRKPPPCWPASSTRPTSAPTRRSTPGRSPTAGHQDHLRCGLGRRLPGGQEGHHQCRQLKGKSLATPSLGNTQDVALRYWLKQHGLTTTPTGGGDVSIKPITPELGPPCSSSSPARSPGGWEPAPYDAEMVARRRATCWSTRPACGRAASSSPPTWSSPRRFLRPTPRGHRPAQGPDRGQRPTSTPTPPPPSTGRPTPS